MALDPRSGEIRALVGGRRLVQRGFNRAFGARRQPGSAFKPFVYAAAMAEGYTPASLVDDSPVEVVDGPRRLKERHLKMTFKQDGRLIRGIHWNAVEREEDLAARKTGLELAYTLEENEFQGEKYLELRVEDFRAPSEQYN